jgi:YVTN family beta-propeller protein
MPGRSAGGSTTAPPTSAAAVIANGSPQSLKIATKPVGAKLTVTLQDKKTLTGTTPFSAQVPGGDITVSLAKPGYNTTVRNLALDGPQSITVWLDPTGLLHESLVRFKCGPNPKQVEFSPDGKELWVSLLGGNGIQVFDPTTGTKLDQVKLGKYGSVEMVFNRAGTRLYVSQMETASVYELDPATRKILRVLKTGGNWTKVLLLSPDEKTLWASNWVSNDVSQIDLATGKVVRRIKTVANPRGLYQTPDGKRLFVAGFKNGDIQRIDVATGKGEVIFKKTGGSMRHMVADEQGGLLYVDDLTSNAVYVMDLATEKVTKLANTDQRPNTMGLSPDGKVLYVS